MCVVAGDELVVVHLLAAMVDPSQINPVVGPSAPTLVDSRLLDIMAGRVVEVMMIVLLAGIVVIPKLVSKVVPMVLSRIINSIGGYESESKWMAVFRGIIFCIFITGYFEFFLLFLFLFLIEFLANLREFWL